jgi:cardiolipin synthase
MSIRWPGLVRALGHALVAGAVAALLAACATLPDTDELIERHAGQAARFENARGPLSAQKSAAILAELKRKSGELDILDKQLALEQAIGGSPLVMGNKVVLLQDGTATYGAMFAAIRAARDNINVESYIIEDDPVGNEFLELLLEQQRRGVQVNLIHDSFGSIGTPKAFFERMTEGGINVLEFNPINPLSLRTGWRINHRDHRKLLVVDGRIAFLGGINISSVYSSGSVLKRRPRTPQDPVPWRDTDLQIEGPVVAELQKLFMDTWGKQRGDALAPRAYFPDLTAQPGDMVRAIGSTPDDPFSLIYLTLISAIGNAERQVQLTHAYFVPDPQLLDSLMAAARRGVEVTIILPGHSDSSTVFHAGRSHYKTLLEAGVRIHERKDALLHSKTALIDGVWSCVGSTNLDWRSFLDNDEINAVVIGREFAAQMQAMFQADLAASDAIVLEQWEARPLTFRIKEWLSGLIQQWL